MHVFQIWSHISLINTTGTAPRAWFFEIAFVREVGMCACEFMRLCVHPPGY